MQVVSPSQRDGLRPDQVAAFKRTAISTIIDAGHRLQMDHLAVAAAIVFLHKFYRDKSLVRNDPFLMSVACLYLGGKVEDSPKSVRDVLMASCELRFRDGARRLAHERDLYEGLREKAFIAERALLYALAFDFHVDHPYKRCISIFRAEPLRGHVERVAARDPRRAQQLKQFPFNFINDGLKTEACLHYDGTQIAAACIWVAMKLLKEDSHITTESGQLWWVALGVKEEHLQGVAALLQQIYTQPLAALYSNNDLVLQSAGLLSPQQLQERAAKDAAAAAAAQQPVAAQALPPDIAAANRESWAVAAAPTAAAAAAQQPAAAAAADDDYDILLDELK